MTREEGIELVRKYDHVIPRKSLEYFLDMTGMKEEDFWIKSDIFRDPRVWWIENGEWYKQNLWGGPSSYGEVHLPKTAWNKYIRKS